MERTHPERDDAASRAPTRAVTSARDADRKPGQFN